MLAFTSSAAETMFGREDGGYLNTMLEQKVEGMNSVFTLDDNTRMVAQQSYAFALEQRHVLLGLLST